MISGALSLPQLPLSLTARYYLHGFRIADCQDRQIPVILY